MKFNQVRRSVKNCVAFLGEAKYVCAIIGYVVFREKMVALVVFQRKLAVCGHTVDFQLIFFPVFLHFQQQQLVDLKFKLRPLSSLQLRDEGAAFWGFGKRLRDNLKESVGLGCRKYAQTGKQ